MDTIFYKYVYNDLMSLTDNELIEHYNIHGKNENRIYSEKDFYNKYPNFDINIYRKLNNDLIKLSDLELFKHYIHHGIFENRICIDNDKLFNIKKLKCAIIFYGLSRSLNKTIHSFKKNIFDILDKNNIQYDIYIHTYKINGKYKNIWSGEETENYHNEDIQNILNPKYLLFDDQSIIENNIDINEYYTFLKWNGYFPEYKVKYMIKNLVLALYSKNKITKLFNENISNYDYGIISRPDLEITNEFDINYFNLLNNYNIIIPEQDTYEGCNDRFCIGNPSIISYYGTLYEKLLEYSKNKNIISECYLLDMLNIKNIDIIKKNICYNTIRI
jgi:hypothetical protein